MRYNKFTVIGLPGVGKSTITKECAALIRENGFFCEIASTDEIIHGRFKADDPVIIAFQKANDIRIPDEIFNSPKPTGAFMKTFGEEPLFRDLEEMFIKDIISSCNSTTWFDLGGKGPLRKGVVNALHDKQIIPVFLYAEHETILERLAKDNNWEKRSNYFNAGQNGWTKLAEEHRTQRLAKYCHASSIIISVEKLSANKNSSVSDEKEDHEIQFKTIKEITREIFFRTKELERSCLSGPSSRSLQKFPTSYGRIIGHN